jgi:hypothetical protein
VLVLATDRLVDIVGEEEDEVTGVLLVLEELEEAEEEEDTEVLTTLEALLLDRAT